MIKVGQVYRDKYFDNKDPNKTHRYIRILSDMGRGKFTAESITDVFGTVLKRRRRTSVSAKTLAASYALVEE